MFKVRCWLLMIFALMLGGEQVLVASTREDRAFNAAASAFQDGIWSRAEVEFAEFAEKYPKSQHAAEATLLQAEADFKQQKFVQAIDLLTAHESQAGRLADQYIYWLGQAQFQNGDYAGAAATFARLTRDFPGSHLRLDAVVNEASARAKLGQWPRVSALLQEPGGVFQSATKDRPAAEPVVRGRLLLAEALLKQDKLKAAAAVLHSLAAQKLGPALAWQRTRLLCHVQLASGDTNAALASTTNLIRLADAAGQDGMRAASVAAQGSVLKQLGQDEAALGVYRENLSTNVPAKWQRQAILQIAELAAAQKKYSEAGQSLQQFLRQFPHSPAAAVAQLTLGELQLKEYVARPAVATNGLQEAESTFNRFLDTYTNSTLIGRAYLDRGWCFWVARNMTNSLADFEAAAEKLPPSVDQAVARFKMGDVLFRQGHFAKARNNYEAVVNDYTNFPVVNKVLDSQALYQTLRACMKLGDMSGATNALARILTIYPTSSLADNSVLLVGEGLSDLQQPAQARALFEKFEQLYPHSPLLPKAELALARTYEQQDNWSAAVGVYNRWIREYTNDTPLLPQAEYARAMANYQAGNETNAFRQMTNFVAQFPTNNWAPIAQWWIAGYYYNTRNNYVDAEKNYELLFQNWPANVLADQAKLMAGRAALARQGYSDAIGYFTMLTGDTNCPANLYVQALFAYGGTLMQWPSSNTNDPLANFEKAIQVFKVISQSYPQSEQAALAWGEIGDCYLQLAGQPGGAHYYNDATNAYARVLASLQADVAARSQAQIGVGLVLEKRADAAAGPKKTALLRQALQNYLDVFYGNNLRDHETADPFWVKKAGLEAASVAEALGEWPQAVKLYRRLAELLPPLRNSLEKKIANAQANITPGQN